jgi:hypothetical protein
MTKAIFSPFVINIIPENGTQSGIGIGIGHGIERDVQNPDERNSFVEKSVLATMTTTGENGYEHQAAYN